MSFKWLLGALKVGRAKMLTSAKNNINILSLYKHWKKTDILNWNVCLHCKLLTFTSLWSVWTAL